MMFSEPLPYSEIKATSKSIAKYCWKRDAYNYNEFVYRQMLKGTKGGKNSKRKPVATAEQSLEPWIKLVILESKYQRRKILSKI